MITKQEIVGNWLVRYTKMPLEAFGQHILLTNFNNYIDLFCDEMNIKPPLCLSRSRFSRKLPPTTVFSELIISSSRTESTTIAATLITRPETWNICAKSRLIQN